VCLQSRLQLCWGGAARADVISIDFQQAAVAAQYTAVGTITDVNGHTSLSGQAGTWNVLELGAGAGWAASVVGGNYTSGTLTDGAGVATTVSLLIETDPVVAHWEHFETGGNLHHDMIGLYNGGSLDWSLSGLEASTLYRLRMFGRESGATDTPFSFSTWIATGDTTTRGYGAFKRNYADLWVTSSAAGEISGTMTTRGDAAAWSGMQIESDMAMPAPVISIDIGSSNTNYPGQVASGIEVDKNGDASLPGQMGPWNELLTGNGTGDTWNDSHGLPHIAGLLDGQGNATAVSFALNTSNQWYTVYAVSVSGQYLTELYRDTIYTKLGVTDKVRWTIGGLAASTEYTLKCFGYQSASGPGLFADFSATGLNTDTGSTSLLTNYVDLVVTSTVNGRITGALVHQGTMAGSTFAGIQIQGSQPFAPAPVGQVISLDFEHANPTFAAIGPIASGTEADHHGDVSLLGQVGDWNAMPLGLIDGAAYHLSSAVTNITGLLDGDGNATTVSFSFNTSASSYTTYTAAPFEDGRTALHRDMAYIQSGNPLIDWKLAGLDARTEYTLKFFGYQYAGATSRYYSDFTATGATTDTGSTSLSQNWVDLVVMSSAAGEITGTWEYQSGEVASSWAGLQILKGDATVPTGTIILVQ